MVLPAATEERFARIECEYAAKGETRDIWTPSKKDDPSLWPARMRKVTRCQASRLENGPAIDEGSL